jgi:CrcB protein
VVAVTDDHPLVRLETLLLIGVGGFAGANLRYFVGLFVPGLGGTLVANATGSVALGFLLYEAIETDLLAERSRVVFGTGLLSSFTTYSTFALQTVQATPLLGVLNVVGSYAFGFLGVLLGRFGAGLLAGGA